ncbi:hypothetical protein LY76DRAFT_14909 [Colletotrichum caudatum]|nr:hypothetical protein LY76DRAFT_14909 [Colletotrichum caudatum]
MQTVSPRGHGTKRLFRSSFRAARTSQPHDVCALQRARSFCQIAIGGYENGKLRTTRVVMMGAVGRRIGIRPIPIQEAWASGVFQRVGEKKGPDARRSCWFRPRTTPGESLTKTVQSSAVQKRGQIKLLALTLTGPLPFSLNLKKHNLRLCPRRLGGGGGTENPVHGSWGASGKGRMGVVGGG